MRNPVTEVNTFLEIFYVYACIPVDLVLIKSNFIYPEHPIALHRHIRIHNITIHIQILCLFFVCGKHTYNTVP